MPNGPSASSLVEANAAPEADLRAGSLISEKYRLLRPAGFGGMSAVWVARNESTGAEVAVKVLLSKGAEPEATERFRREAYAAAQLSHRGIVRVFDLIALGPPHAGSLAMVMEFLRGETLSARLDRHSVFSTQETLDIILPLLSALGYAHRAGIVHRDLKPDNVFLAVDPDGHMTPKILDFGISKLTAAEVPSITTDGAMLGTPNYMSPEQARGSAQIDARSDIFTVGILLYELLGGKNPFDQPSYHSVVAAILERDPSPLENIPYPLWAVLQRALQKRPERRYRTADELAKALREATQQVGDPLLRKKPNATEQSLPPAAQSSEPPPVPAGLPTERRWIWKVGVAAVVLLAAGAATWSKRSSESRAASSPSGASPAIEKFEEPRTLPPTQLPEQVKSVSQPAASVAAPEPPAPNPKPMGARGAEPPKPRAQGRSKKSAILDDPGF